MKEKLSAVVSAETGNVVAICCNIDDAIDMALGYERRSGNRYEVQDVSKYGAKCMIEKDWFQPEVNVIEVRPSQPHNTKQPEE